MIKSGFCCFHLLVIFNLFIFTSIIPANEDELRKDLNIEKALDIINPAIACLCWLCASDRPFVFCGGAYNNKRGGARDEGSLLLSRNCSLRKMNSAV